MGQKRRLECTKNMCIRKSYLFFPILNTGEAESKESVVVLRSSILWQHWMRSEICVKGFWTHQLLEPFSLADYCHVNWSITHWGEKWVWIRREKKSRKLREEYKREQSWGMGDHVSQNENLYWLSFDPCCVKSLNVYLNVNQLEPGFVL